jgi:hypothetical protein
VTDFSLLVATINAYATEGGLDGPGEPTTCYNAPIALGMLDAPGEASRLWTRYESLLDAANDLGIRRVEVAISWARIEPREGHVDPSAIDRYRDLINHGRANGLAVGLNACDGAWPAWLGNEPWIWPWTTPVTLRHLERVAATFDTAASLDFFPDRAALRQGFIDASGPPWRQRARADAQLTDETVASIRTVAIEQGWLRPPVEGASTRALVSGAGPLTQRHPLLADRGDGWVRA